MHKILFVCHGNICRSTMAQYVLQHMVQVLQIAPLFVIDSAGTSTEELGNSVHHGTRKKLESVGIACGGHTARQLQQSEVANWDLLLGMDSANIRNMQRICNNENSQKIKRLLSFTNNEKDIADPWYTGNFDATYTDVRTGCLALLQHLGYDTKEL